MYQFKLLTPQDRKEAAAIERRRQFEEERKKRIFHAKNRIIGIDREALEKQVKEKEMRENEQQKLDEFFIAQLRRDSQIAMELEKREKEERRHINEEINKFRCLYQKVEQRREFDLYDPDGLKKSLPARVLDDDGRCGISSAQKFEGEDLASEQRTKIQSEQQKAWLKQQLEERNTAEKERKMAEDAYQVALINRDARAVELDRLDKECRRRLNEATVRYNQALAAEQEFKRQANESQELGDKYAEMYNLYTSDMLCENHTHQSNLGSNRPIAYAYRGMTPEEKEAVIHEQLRQISQNKEKKEEEKQKEKDWNEYMNSTAKTLIMMDREQRRQKREINKKIANENVNLSQQQKNNQNYLDNIIYTNRPSGSYFDQFNTSTR